MSFILLWLFYPPYSTHYRDTQTAKEKLNCFFHLRRVSFEGEAFRRVGGGATVTAEFETKK